MKAFFSNPWVAAATGALVLYVVIGVTTKNWNPFKKAA